MIIFIDGKQKKVKKWMNSRETEFRVFDKYNLCIALHRIPNNYPMDIDFKTGGHIYHIPSTLPND